MRFAGRAEQHLLGSAANPLAAASLSPARCLAPYPAQLADSASHSFFGRPEHDTTPRPVYLVSSSTGGADVAAEYAAAFAAAALLFNTSDSAYAAALFKRAEQAWGFALAHQRNFVIQGAFQAYSTYAANGYLAHLAWAAGWLCRFSAAYCGAARTWFDTAMATGLRYSLG